MYDHNAVLLKHGGPGCRISSRSEHNLHSFTDNDFELFLNLREEQRNINSKRFVCCSVTLPDLLPEHVGSHRPGSKQSKSAGIAHSGSQSPATAPDHACLDDGETDAKKRVYPVIQGLVRMFDDIQILLMALFKYD
jgi:hypothetical protein